jgi:hypothetical protein
MGPGSNIPPSSSATDAATAITWRGSLPRFAVLIPRSAMGSWSVEWEDDNEPEGWVARRMAAAFARMWAAAQSEAAAADAIRAALDAEGYGPSAQAAAARAQAITAQATTLAAATVGRWRFAAASSAVASLVALVATRPAHGPPALAL